MFGRVILANTHDIIPQPSLARCGDQAKFSSTWHSALRTLCSSGACTNNPRHLAYNVAKRPIVGCYIGGLVHIQNQQRKAVAGYYGYALWH
jgi:hypothetical protein